MIAVLRAREHLAHALAQLELLYNTICGSMGRFARVRASLRVPCDRIVRRVLPGCTPGTAFAHVEPEMRMYMIVLSVVVVQW